MGAHAFRVLPLWSYTSRCGSATTYPSTLRLPDNPFADRVNSITKYVVASLPVDTKSVATRTVVHAYRPSFAA